MKAKKLGASNLDAPRLVWGVGINDADYVVQKWKTIGYVNGKNKTETGLGVPLLPSLEGYATALLLC